MVLSALPAPCQEHQPSQEKIEARPPLPPADETPSPEDGIIGGIPGGILDRLPGIIGCVQGIIDRVPEIIGGVPGGIMGGVPGGVGTISPLLPPEAAEALDMLALRGPIGDRMLFAFQTPPRQARSDEDDRMYERGQRDLEKNRWDQALESFSAVASKGGSRADGALYWKAYAQAKLGRRDDALASLAELRKTYPSSRWLDDAKALDIEIRQASGQRVSPESAGDEDLKLMALNGLMNSDPDHAVPLLEKLLHSSQSPKIKERALFVLTQSGSSQAR